MRGPAIVVMIGKFALTGKFILTTHFSQPAKFS